MVAVSYHASSKSPRYLFPIFPLYPLYPLYGFYSFYPFYLFYPLYFTPFDISMGESQKIA